MPSPCTHPLAVQPQSPIELSSKVKRKFVYIIKESTGEECTTTGYYKVGRTENLKTRISDLRTANHNNLRYYYVVEVTNNIKAEAEAHRKLEDFHIKNLYGGNEWYQVGQGQLYSFITMFDRAIEEFTICILNEETKL